MIVTLMKHLATPANRFADCLVGVVLAGVPFYGFLTVWGNSLIGHYTALRLWDDALLLLLFGIACWWLAKDRELLSWLAHSLLFRLILAYCMLTILLGFVALAKGEVTGKALEYGLRVNLRFVVWLLAVLLTARRSPFLRRVWPKLLLVPAIVVVVFGVLQYTVLPHDFLGHFGYNTATTIAPIETINHNAHYIRVQSTLRGANPLGAYLVIVLSALGVLFMRGRRKVLCAAFGVVALAALYASGSRSAWIGAVLTLGVIGWLLLNHHRQRYILGGTGLLVLVLAGSLYLLFQHNVRLQNEVLHTQTNSVVQTTSNSAHASALREGLHDIWRQPLGDGPGTAGPASVYNSGHPTRIAEDYYVQIAQEVGWLGLALFLSILALVALELYEQASASRLALVMLASFAGLAFVNLLSHAWADDTLAYVWWGLAGIALARPPQKEGKMSA
jgi:O-antigen ligase/polysaccharide polymerase Wzy-like membrane protein